MQCDISTTCDISVTCDILETCDSIAVFQSSWKYFYINLLTVFRKIFPFFGSFSLQSLKAMIIIYMILISIQFSINWYNFDQLTDDI